MLGEQPYYSIPSEAQTTEELKNYYWFLKFASGYTNNSVIWIEAFEEV